MNRLNYHHLLYFWTVARYTGLSRAADELLLSRSTLSAQIHQLEDTLGHKLMRREGRRLALTDAGQVIFDYCDRMFSIGRELEEVVSDENLSRPRQIRIGVADVIPRLMIGKLLKPLFSQSDTMRVVCREDHARRLIAELAIHNLDMVISDTPAGASSHIRGHSQRLGASTVAFFGSRSLASKFKAGFPVSLNGAPVLLPGAGSMLRSNLENWFESRDIRPRIMGDFDDRDLLEVFGQQEVGLFPAPLVIRRELAREYGVELIGNVGDVQEEYYVITLQRQAIHPSIQRVVASATEKLLAGKSNRD